MQVSWSMTVNKESLEQWVERVFQLYERHVRKTSQARKHETTQCNTAKLNQPRPNMAAPRHRHTARETSCE